MLAAAVDPALAVVKEFPKVAPDALLDALCQGCPDEALFQDPELHVWQKPEIIHLNHHAALHSGWRPEHVRALQKLGYGVVVTQHDTFEKADIMWERGMVDFRVADYLIVHERVEGLAAVLYDPAPAPHWGRKVFTLRQPVPNEPVGFTLSEVGFHRYRGSRQAKLLGLFGFDFPWKGFDMAVRAAAAAGWEVFVASPGMSEARQAELAALHEPGKVACLTEYAESMEAVVRSLRLCDATAFLYSTGNSGTSSAIRAGIATRKPVIALKGCRQFRDLELDKNIGHLAICWASSEEQVTETLKELATNAIYYKQVCLRTEQLAIMDSWRTAGNTYGLIYRELQDRKAVRNA